MAAERIPLPVITDPEELHSVATAIRRHPHDRPIVAHLPTQQDMWTHSAAIPRGLWGDMFGLRRKILSLIERSAILIWMPGVPL